MKVTISIKLKPEILDPQGEAIAHSLKTLGFKGIEAIRQGKIVEVDLKDKDREKAILKIKKMGILVNIIKHFLVHFSNFL